MFSHYNSFLKFDWFTKNLKDELSGDLANIPNSENKILILDFRENLGGNFESVLWFLDNFLNSRLFLKTRNKEDKSKTATKFLAIVKTDELCQKPKANLLKKTETPLIKAATKANHAPLLFFMFMTTIGIIDNFNNFLRFFFIQFIYRHISVNQNIIPDRRVFYKRDIYPPFSRTSAVNQSHIIFYF